MPHGTSMESTPSHPEPRTTSASTLACAWCHTPLPGRRYGRPRLRVVVCRRCTDDFLQHSRAECESRWR